MKKGTVALLGSAAAIAAAVIAFAADNRASRGVDTPAEEKTMTDGPTAYATFGAGCFWCSEAMFETREGVVSVLSGYQGGELKKPSYKQICRGDTGHAEVVRVEYDPATVTYEQLLDLFWKMHDPTTLNRQGADVGTQYRSVIFYHDEAQRVAAEKSLKEMDASGTFDRPIVTQIQSAPDFYEAEDYHQDYYRANPQAPYSRYIRGKLEKMDKE